MRKFFAIMVAVVLVTPFSIGCGDKKKTEKSKATTTTTRATRMKDKDDDRRDNHDENREG